MKLHTLAICSILGMCTASAAAFAVPKPAGEWRAEASADSASGAKSEAKKTPARFVAGQTLMVDARLGHASLESKDGETFLFAQVTAGESTKQAPPVSLALVIDRSGSMKGDRLANAIAAAELAVERMRDGDEVTVVAFDQSAEVVVRPTRVSTQTKEGILRSIRGIRLGGDTCISCGLETAMRELERNGSGGPTSSRVLLLSDGATNFGVRDIPGLRTMVSRLSGRGHTISTIGVDVDFDEKVMAAIANEGNGSHYFVANANGLPNVFAQEFDNVLASVARDAEMQIELAPGVEVVEVFDRTFRREGDRIIVPFGTFSGKQEKTVLLRVKVQPDKVGARDVAKVALAYRDIEQNKDGACKGELALQLVDDGSGQKDLDPFVAARLERSRTGKTLTEANRLFEEGKAKEARDKLASQSADLKRAERRAVAIAAANPFAAPARASKSLDRDFADQATALADAEEKFAAPPVGLAGPKGDARGFGSGAGSRPSSPAASAAGRVGKEAVRQNQKAASDLAF